MYPTLYLLPRSVAGVPLWGVGLVLALWLAGWGVWLAMSLRREGWSANVRGQLPVILVGALILALATPRIGDDRGLPIRGYGVMLLVAIGLSLGITLRRARQRGIDPELLYSLLFWLLVPGIVGARLFYVIEYWPEFRAPTWSETLTNVAMFTEGGLVVYGSAIAAGLALFVFARIHRLPALALADLVAPAGALAMGLGRVGCFLNGCCYGGTTDLPWGVRFPYGSPPYVDQVVHGKLPALGIQFDGGPEDPPRIARVVPASPAEAAGLAAGQVLVKVESRSVRTVAQAERLLATAGRDAGELLVWTRDEPVARRLAMPKPIERSAPVHPAQLYSALDGILLACLLWAMEPFRRRDGAIFAWYLTLYPISRFLQEIVRTDESAIWQTGMSISQNVSLGLLVLAAIVWWVVLRSPARVSWPAAASPTTAPRTAAPAT